MTFSGLPPEIHTHIGCFLDARSLLAYCATCRALGELQWDQTWRALCKARWQPWPRYRLTERRAELWLELAANGAPINSWLGRYRWVEADAARKELRDGELSQLEWWFNFTPSAGGRGRQTLTRAQFGNDGFLRLLNYPPLPYRVEPREPHEIGWLTRTFVRATVNFLEAVGDGQFTLYERAPARQAVIISNFPLHTVQRLESKEWLIENENVMLVSCEKGGEPTYDERNFLTVPPEEPPIGE